MTHELQSYIFPPFWVLNPNIMSEYLNDSLEFRWYLSLFKFYINKVIDDPREVHMCMKPLILREIPEYCCVHPRDGRKDTWRTSKIPM